MVDSIEPQKITPINHTRQVTKNRLDKTRDKPPNPQRKEKEKADAEDQRVGTNVDEIC